MRITAITKYKHGAIWALMQKLGWSVAGLSRNSGVSLRRAHDIVSLRRRPNQAQADAIQRAFGEAGEYLDVLEEWPETFNGLPEGFSLEQTADVPIEQLLDCPEAMRLPAPSTVGAELSEAVDKAIASLPTERLRLVIEDRFFNGLTLADTGKKHKLCIERTRQIEARALRDLRHRSRVEPIRELKEILT